MFSGKTWLIPSCEQNVTISLWSSGFTLIFSTSPPHFSKYISRNLMLVMISAGTLSTRTLQADHTAGNEQQLNHSCYYIRVSLHTHTHTNVVCMLYVKEK